MKTAAQTNSPQTGRIDPPTVEDATIAQLKAQLEAAQADSRRLDWLESKRDNVRGTDFPVWKVEGFIEDGRGNDLTLRQAIDECIHNGCPG